MADKKQIKTFKRFEVYWVSLNPTVGSEIQKTRPCVIVSPDDLNYIMATVIVAPFTSTKKKYNFRADSDLKSVKGQIALDQIRAVDKSRLGKKIAVLNKDNAENILEKLTEMFAE